MTASTVGKRLAVQSVAASSGKTAGEEIRFSTKCLALLFFMTFVNPTGWDSIGFIWPFWLAYILIATFEDTRGIGLLRKPLDSFSRYPTLVAWVFYSIIVALAYFNVGPSLRIGLYCALGGLFLLVVVNIRLNEREIKLIINAYIVMAFLMAAMVILFGHNLQGFETRYTISVFGQDKDPNYLSAFILFPCIASCWWLLQGKKVYVIPFAVITLGIVRCASRAAVISLTFGLLILVVYAMKERRFRLRTIFLACILLVVSFLILPDQVMSRFTDLDSYQDGSNHLRFLAWQGAFGIWLDHPLFGAGEGAFEAYGEQYGVVNEGMVHNTYLDVLAGTGLIGFILFAVFLLSVLMQSIRRKSPLTIAAVCAVLFASLIISAQYSQYLWIDLALACSIAQLEPDKFKQSGYFRTKQECAGNEA